MLQLIELGLKLWVKNLSSWLKA